MGPQRLLLNLCALLACLLVSLSMSLLLSPTFANQQECLQLAAVMILISNNVDQVNHNNINLGLACSVEYLHSYQLVLTRYVILTNPYLEQQSTWPLYLLC